MKTLTFLLMLVAAAAFAPGSFQARAQAQPSDTDEIRAYMELLRSDVNTTKIRTINEVMKLTGPEAETFWPIYRKYEKELAGVGDRKLALIREFAALHAGGTLDPAKATELAEGWLKNTQERLALWRKYHKQIRKAVSPIRAVQFLQVEHQMALFIDLGIASEMPAVGVMPGKRP